MRSTKAALLCSKTHIWNGNCRIEMTSGKFRPLGICNAFVNRESKKEMHLKNYTFTHQMMLKENQFARILSLGFYNQNFLID